MLTLTLTPIAGFGLAFLIALALTPWVLKLALKIGAIDRRVVTKIHARDVPRLGGLAIACGFYLPVLGLALRSNLYSGYIYHDDPWRVAALLGGGLVIIALGVWDDVHGTKAWQKLSVQLPVAALTWYAGVRIGLTATPTGREVMLAPALSLVATVGWIVIVMNAINLIDGLDGLASGVAFQTLVTIAIAAWLRGEPVLALFAICLSGSVGGFLVHNFHPASIFMGDSGSLFLGYVIAVATAWSAQKTATVIGVVLPVITLALPLLDTSMAVWRRLITGRKVMHGDLDHIHHRLLQRGFTQRRSVLTLYAMGLVFSAMSVWIVCFSDPRLHWPMVGLALIVALVFARWLGYLSKNAGCAAAQAEQPG